MASTGATHVQWWRPWARSCSAGGRCRTPGLQYKKRGRAPKAAAEPEPPAPAPKKPAAKKRKAAEPPEAPKEPATKAKQRKAEPETTMEPPDDSVRIVFTNYEPSISERGILKLLGFSEVGARDATHVITKAPLKRTPKLMIGLSTASYVVTGEWLGACLASDGRADEKPFMVKDRAKEQLWGFNLARSLAQNPSVKVLSGYAVALAPGARDASMMLPSDSELQDIVECAGGRWLSTVPRGVSEELWPNGVLVIGCKELVEGSDRIATRCIGALSKLDAGVLAGVVEPPTLYGAVLAKTLDLSRRNCLQLPAACAHVVRRA